MSRSARRASPISPTGDERGEEHQLTLHAWSRQGGHKEAHLIAGALLQALDDAPLTLDGHQLVNLRFRARRHPPRGRRAHLSRAGALPRACTEPALNRQRGTAHHGCPERQGPARQDRTTARASRHRRGPALAKARVQCRDRRHHACGIRRTLARAARRRRRQARRGRRPRPVQGRGDRRADAPDLLRRRGEELPDRHSGFRHGRRARSRSPASNSPASTTARSPTSWRWSRPAS